MAGNAKSEQQLATSKLADRLLASLKALRETDPANYPPSIGELAKHADCTASQRQISKSTMSKSAVLAAARMRCFTVSTIAARSNSLESPIALLEDLPLLAAAPATLLFALNHCSQNKTKAHTLARLAAPLTGRADGEFRKQFRRSVELRLQAQDLPQDVGCIVAGGARQHFFRLDDLEPASWRQAIRTASGLSTPEARSTPAANSSHTTPTVDFSAAFETAFTRLDRSQGGYNFVSLDRLRTALPAFSPAEFDAELRQLRLARRYRLSGAENRSDVSPEQRQAGINEAGSLLLYAQRIES